jgi:hypothetical protein
MGTVRADSPQKYDVISFAKEHGVTHVCMEKPMPFKGTHASVGLSMNISYGRWLEACEREGLVVVPALVTVWQKAMLVINGAKVPAKLGTDSKHGSMLVARYHGAQCRNGDESDAVMLCLFGPQAVVYNEDKEQAKAVVRKAKATMRRKARKGA